MDQHQLLEQAVQVQQQVLQHHRQLIQVEAEEVLICVEQLLLEELVVARKTARRYRERVEPFLEKRRKAGKARLATIGDVDRAVEAEIGDMWWEGDPRGWAADLVSGVQHFYPRCRKKLVSAWRLYGAWNRLEYPNRAPPMDLRLALAVAGRFWRQGRRRTAVAPPGRPWRRPTPPPAHSRPLRPGAPPVRRLVRESKPLSNFTVFTVSLFTRSLNHFSLNRSITFHPITQ